MESHEGRKAKFVVEDTHIYLTALVSNKILHLLRRMLAVYFLKSVINFFLKMCINIGRVIIVMVYMY